MCPVWQGVSWGLIRTLACALMVWVLGSYLSEVVCAAGRRSLHQRGLCELHWHSDLQQHSFCKFVARPLVVCVGGVGAACVCVCARKS